ncbi:LemA family protein [Patescibacteria group bacterium]|nr:LemA family protein [Patescibacteria group bacterium]
MTAQRTGSNDVELDGQVSSAVKNLLVVAENYPNLKASTNFNTLQLQIEGIEDRLQAARRTYNAAVKHLLDKKMMFPGNLIAGMVNIPDFPMFEVVETEKANLQV